MRKTKTKMKIVKCENCGKPLKVAAYGSRRRYCDRKCAVAKRVHAVKKQDRILPGTKRFAQWLRKP